MTGEESERYRRGARRLAELGGDIESIAEPFRDLAPDLARYVGEFAFGDLYHRPGLSLRDKQLVTIAALTAMGDVDRQLAFHVRAGVVCGLEPREIVDAVIHLLAFAGNPRVYNAMLVVEREISRQADGPPAPGAGAKTNAYGHRWHT